MAYSTQEGMYTVGDLGEGPSFWEKYKTYILLGAVAAAAGGFWYWKKQQGEMSDYSDIGDTGCGCGL